MQSTETSFFLYVYEVIIKCYPNFLTCLYFLLALIRWNSTHCHLIYLMELYKSKESCKGQVDSDNNWKTAWQRMILEWHLFLRLSFGFVRKMLSFVRKHLSFYPNDVCSFSAFFLIKYVENKISNSTSHKKKKKKERERNKNIIQLRKHHFKNAWKIVTSYTSYWLSQIITFTTYCQTLTKSMLNFESCSCYFK